ncbi:hypothetical protein GQ43DRAFT_376507 [Delitschia confertaspora ATCC 74209]|uniref:DUF1996 domain-containing protein n=1 Tax=Delitschia confertaspora ATCC 74209 TaxID=1513339 RepID=A0A9P4JHP9_9PLEO|nr:hypothetical protein GQ43DRAFT_376507 [Delitschia confertaspora ATCC 74209]
MFAKVLSLAALVASVSAADFNCNGPYFSFYNRGGELLSNQRLDPALYPGVQSPHLHSFDGGNGLAAQMEFETTQKSTCTTARIKADKSLYWRPTLYWNGNNTGYYRVPNLYVKVYYKFMYGDKRANVTEFPEDFAMMAGNPFQRSESSSAIAQGANIKWSCKDANYVGTDAKGFPKGFTSCKQGLVAEITFPSCWNGKQLDPKNPYAHMAYPAIWAGEGNDPCPATHRVAKFPTIFIEFWYDVSAFDGHYNADSVPWVLSMGDPTGYGFHADFRNGWEKGVLAKATAKTGYCDCGCGCDDAKLKACFGAQNFNDNSDPTFQKCTAKPQYPGEDSTKPLQKLPGCNPIQKGPADATLATCGASARAVVEEEVDTTSVEVELESHRHKRHGLVHRHSFRG